jgi:hypothetical protein
MGFYTHIYTYTYIYTHYDNIDGVAYGDASIPG